MRSPALSIIFWARRNLFATPKDIALTALLVLLSFWAISHVIYWAVFVARWDVVSDSLRVFLVGTLPSTELWRAWAALLLVASIVGSVSGLGFAIRPRHMVFGILLFVILAVTFVGNDIAALAALSGVMASFAASWLLVSRLAPSTGCVGLFVTGSLAIIVMILAPAGMDRWGGLLLSLIFTLVSSFFILLFGVILAFGRRSSNLALRLFCIMYIESMRSLPLILIVYWIWIAGPLFLPTWNVATVTRGIAGFVVYFSAVAAESVRGGLQGLPKGQLEAARSLGLGEFAINFHILLPQALRASLPALMGNILDVFNFVPVIFVVGLADFLRTGEMVLASPAYSDRTYEVYVFMLATYFVIGSVLTFVARGLEHNLAKGSRRLSELD
jgi:general L-amino acid transport system permease protein